MINLSTVINRAHNKIVAQLGASAGIYHSLDLLQSSCRLNGESFDSDLYIAKAVVVDLNSVVLISGEIQKALDNFGFNGSYEFCKQRNKSHVSINEIPFLDLLSFLSESDLLKIPDLKNQITNFSASLDIYIEEIRSEMENYSSEQKSV
jgi:hypothetical protein